MAGSGGGGSGGSGDSGGSGGMAKNKCPGPIIASWKADGVPFVASSVGYGAIGDVWQLVMVECVDDAVDRTVQLVRSSPRRET